ncbi:hypothetical protein F5Y17DRAFT_43627 [Xylariaceae sp. FL0594]|nr:hypothetical protein F5Y17DRAFT_43627 [Xylariaceae sp. FL0594]
MAALVHTYSQQSGTVTLLQTAPGSSVNIMPGQGHSGQNLANPQRNAYNGSQGGTVSQAGYRNNVVAPVQPYAFTSTPSLASIGQIPQNGGYRSSSGTTVPTLATMVDARLQSPPATTNRPLVNATNQPTFAQVASSKAPPERYRRPATRQTGPSPALPQTQQAQGSGFPSGPEMATAAQNYNPRAVARSPSNVVNRPQSAYGAITGTTMDDMQLYRHTTDDEAKKFRRRSIHSINSSDYFNPLSSQGFRQAFHPDTPTLPKKPRSGENDQKPSPRLVPLPPPANGLHARSNSSDSIVSSRSSNSRPSSSTNRNSNASAPTGSPASSSLSGDKSPAHDQPKFVNIPPRSSSADVNKRVLSPSPLSNPVTMATGPSPKEAGGTPAIAQSSVKPPTSSQGPNCESPAAKHLAAINEMGAKSKSKTSRLRRAFSFGSAAELRKVTGQDTAPESRVAKTGESARLQKAPRGEDWYEEEQARIAQKQEEGGIGSSIYSGTTLFSGSTDNLSISSTASSASIMLRKMGRGVKKGGRSLVGLFRPKSVIGSPAEEITTPEASQAAVSMVTVEAERDRVNVNTNAELAHATGTGFPRLERNSIDATKNAESATSDRPGTSQDSSVARKSIIGGERERAEVLATIRKGILKTTRSSSPTAHGADSKGPMFDLPMIPTVADSPNSSAPSTPNDEVHAHRRNGSVTIGNEDYFMSALRLRQDTKSAPATPQAGHKRNATFSPRIVFYDTWPSGEYDRRGEIATCNRLTPMLAQQIKEELNSFKMEMEVHETSKIYTHFF